MYVKTAETGVGREGLRSRHVIAITIKELLEAVFSVPSVPRLYNEDRLPLRDKSLKTEDRRTGGRYEMGATLRGREPGSRATSTVGSRY
jgi:hypothetical protein